MVLIWVPILKEQSSEIYYIPGEKKITTYFLSQLPSEFRSFKNKSKWKPYAMPKINKMVLKLEGFKFYGSLHLIMRYDHI